jgi:hypothetical protein
MVWKHLKAKQNLSSYLLESLCVSSNDEIFLTFHISTQTRKLKPLLLGYKNVFHLQQKAVDRPLLCMPREFLKGIKLHKDGLHDFHFLSRIVEVIKSRRMRWTKHETGMGDIKFEPYCYWKKRGM